MRLFAKLFERQLRLRGFWFSFDENTQTYQFEHVDGFVRVVSLANVSREFATDGDTNQVTRFADNMLSPPLIPTDWQAIEHKVFWEILSNTLEEQSDLAFHLSDHTHHMPVIFDRDSSQILFLYSRLLIEMSVTEDMVARAADRNLAVELRKAEIGVRELEGVRAGFICSGLPFKASLILAPNLREVAEPVLGWPLYAVIPNRSALYIFAANDFDGVADMFRTLPGLGAYVLDEHDCGAYPLSTEIFEITDKGVRAVAEYRRDAPSEAEAQNYEVIGRPG